MSGWRDTEGRTHADRRRKEGAQQRAQLADRIRQRPMSLLRPALFGLFILIVIAAIALR